MTTELFADCAMIWLGTSAAATSIVLAVLQLRDKRRAFGKTRALRLVS